MPMLLQQLLCNFGLQRRKFEDFFSILFNYKAHGAVAKIAHAVEEDDGREHWNKYTTPGKVRYFILWNVYG